MPEILVHEVGLRDGLQMESEPVPTQRKLDWSLRLIEAGVDVLQVGSFVHPKWVPQMADTDELFHRLISVKCDSSTVLSGLVLNERGLERGLACGVELFCMGVSASETHSQKNTRMSVDEALERTLSMAKAALAEKRAVQVSVQSAFGCGYEGLVSQTTVLKIVDKYLEAGLTNVSLADTAGHANPAQVRTLFKSVLGLGGEVHATCHFHNNYGLALANCWAAMEVGVCSFESSFGGLGGCPFTAVPGGNTCTEDLIHMFQRMGLRKEIDLVKLVGIAVDASQFFGRDLPGSVYRAGVADSDHSAVSK
jgi:hydroxymethylglutaryl-CoA lyase